MNLKSLEKTWDRLGVIDPLWAILSFPNKRGCKWELGEFFKSGKTEIIEIMKYAKLLSVKISFEKALDFGCGVGRLTQALADYFDLVYGVDIAPSMIKSAEKYNQYPDRCKYFLNKTYSLKIFPDNYFDFVYSNITLQHMLPKYSKKYIQEFLRILKYGGLLIFQIPSHQIEQFSQRKKVEEIIKKLTPKKILELRGKIKKTYPKIEMHGVKKNEVVRILEFNKGKILAINQNDVAGKEWVSFNYCVTK